MDVLLLIALLLFSGTDPAVAEVPPKSPVAVTVLPGKVFLERWGGLQRISCDFQLTNSADKALDIEGVYAKAFAADGTLLQWVKVDSNGGRRSIEVLGRNRIEPGAALTVFNPFEFDTPIAIDHLTYEFRLRSSSNEQLQLSIQIHPEIYRQKTRLIVPVPGARLWAYDGPGFLSHHRRVDLLDPFNRDVLRIRGNGQRYALDLVVLDREGSPFHGDLSVQENWVGFRSPIVAPASGIVIDAEGTLPDDIPFDEDQARKNPLLMIGNHVVIDHGNGEYSLLVHFRRGGVRVEKGQRVVVGEVIGEMGHSGMGSGLVHLHYQLQDGPGLFDAEGLPAKFEGYRRTGSGKPESGPIEAGWVIETQAVSPAGKRNSPSGP